MFKDTLLGTWELGVQSEDFLASCHFQVCFSSLWYAISLTYPVLLLLHLCKSSSRLQQSTGRQLRSRNVSYYIICSMHRHIVCSLSLSLPARIVHERSQWKITSLEEKLHGSCDCFSNFLAGWCVCSDDVSFTFMIHENL